MHVKTIFIAMCIAGASTAYGTPKQPQQAANNTLVFVENKGQVTDQYYQPRTDIDFRIGGNDVNLFVGNAAMHYQWVQPTVTKLVAGDTLQEFSTYRMDVQLVGANPDAKVLKEQKQDFYERYYTSTFSEPGAIANSYQRVTYKEVYPNIDWVLYIKNNTIEYDFVVRPGGIVSDIKLHYSGASNVQVNKDGSLTATTPFGTVTEAAPYSFQQADGIAVASSFKLENNILSFDVGDYEGTLVIDPVLEWSTYYGGSMNENIRQGGMAGDQYGNIFLGGYTNSVNNIATTGAFQDTVHTGLDAMIAKFNASGNLIWSSYFGGAGNDYGHSVACDALGNIYLSGYVPPASVGLATSGAFQPTIAGGSDAFLVKFDSMGVRHWSTYYGGSGNEQSWSLVCDQSNNIYMAGQTQSAANISSSGSAQTTLGGAQDGFLVKFDPLGNRIWGTYFGGTANDLAIALAADPANNIFMCGMTQSTSGISTPGVYQSILGGGQDAFLVKYDSAGLMVWSSYFGGPGNDRAVTLSTNANNVFIAGNTTSSVGIASSTAQQSTFGGGFSDGFMAKFDMNGQRLWSSYFGGPGIDESNAIVETGGSSFYLIGTTNSSTGIATTGSFKDTIEGYDAFFSKIDTSGVILWSSYFGGSGNDFGMCAFAGPQSTLHIAGETQSTFGLSTVGSQQENIGGNRDLFLALFNDCQLQHPNQISGPDTSCAFTVDSYSTASIPDAQSYQWILPTGWHGNSNSNTITVTKGNNSGSIQVVAIFPCGMSDTTSLWVELLPAPAISPIGPIGICEGDTMLLSVSSGLSYQWLKNGQEITGAIQSDLAIYEAGSYQVISHSLSGCIDTSENVLTIINPLPQPQIARSGNELSTGNFVSYQWYHNGLPITGANSSHYIMNLQTGAYTVKVTDTNNCSGVSEPFEPSLSTNERSGETIAIKIYPNPSNGIVYLDAPTPMNMHVIDITGRLVKQTSNSRSIDLHGLADGLYLIQVYDQHNQTLGSYKVSKESKQ